MRKIFLFTAIAALSSFISCNKMETPADNQVTINITVSDPSPDTNAVKTGWESGDKINIRFDSNKNAQPDLVLTFNGTKWEPGTISDAVLSGLKTDGTGILYGSYEAFNNLSLYTEDSYYRLIAPVAPYSEAAVGTKAYCMPLAVYSKDISYEYDSVSKVLTANINDWKFNTNLQVVVTGLEGDASDYGLKINSTDYIRYGFSFSEEAKSNWQYPSPTTPNTNAYTGGVANADGVAFYFAALYISSFTRAMTLYNFKTKTKIGEYTTASFAASPGRLTGVKIDKSKFTTL